MKKTEQRLFSAVLALLLLMSLVACAAPKAPAEPANTASTALGEPVNEVAQTHSFTDSVGREVTLPIDIQRVAVSGPLAQIVLFALCPNKLAGIATQWDETAAAYLEMEYYALPVLGQLYGGKGELNPETLLAAEIDVVIDIGEPKKTIVEDLDALQEQTGIPFVHITAQTTTTGDAYRKLGELLNMPDEAERLASYCEDTYERICKIVDSVEKKDILYVSGDTGANVIAKTSYHAEIIDLLANNLAEVDEPSSKGTGNEVDFEQILQWDPAYIFFAPGSVYGTVAEDAAWSSLRAIRDGNYYEVPFGPYNWMGFPPSLQRYLGMLWMAKLLYPEAASYDLYDEVREYYELFYHCELSEAQYDALVANSLGKQAA